MITLSTMSRKKNTGRKICMSFSPFVISQNCLVALSSLRKINAYNKLCTEKSRKGTKRQNMYHTGMTLGISNYR